MHEVCHTFFVRLKQLNHDFMKYLIFLTIILIPLIADSQVAINMDGSDPDSSAILDMSSTTKGLLMPRMTTAQRMIIDNPATGLMVYDTDLDKFYCHAGGAWVELMSGYLALLQDSDSDTRIEVEAAVDEDTIRFRVSDVEVAKLDTKTLHLASQGQSVFVGKDAGSNDIDVFTRNTFLGYESGKINTTGGSNTASGFRSFYSNETGSANVAVGFEALYSHKEGNYNVANGFNALHFDTSGHDNVAIGAWALYHNLSGLFNVANGSGALFFNITGGSNVANGYRSLFSNETGHFNVANGYQALYANSNGSRNVGIGYESNRYNQQGFNNTIVGYAAGRGISAHNKSGNVFIGHKAGYFETGDNNLYIDNTDTLSPLLYGEFDNNLLRINGKLEVTGGLSGFSDTDGDTKIQLEESADEDVIRFDIGGVENFVMNGPRLEVLNSGSSVFIGANAGENDDLSLNKNVFIGANSGKLNTTGFSNIAVGYDAFSSNVTGNYNTATGYQALLSNETGAQNTALGFETLYSHKSGNWNTAIGYKALHSDTTGTGNVAIGSNTMSNNFSSVHNVAVGDNALRDNTTGDHNVAIGAFALRENSIGHHNVATGYNALYNNIQGVENVAIGHSALYNNTASDITAIGSEALSSNTSGTHNTAVGRRALNSNTTGYQNTAIGKEALVDNTTGPYNIALGNSALQHNLTGSRNVAIGHIALRDATGDRNVAVGVDAGQQNTGSNNVFFGFESGQTNTGSTNVFLGYRSGKNATGSNQLFIDNSDDATPLIYGEFADDELVINGELGINKINPAHPIHLSSGAHVTVGGVWTNASDISKKKNIDELPYGLSEIMLMDPKKYEYKADGSSSIGFVAQEMEKIIPEAVSGEEGEKGIAYGLLTSVLVQGIQVLVENNEKLTTQVKSQQVAMEVLMARVDALEKNQQ